MRRMLYAGALLVAACGDVDVDTVASAVTSTDLAINVDPNGPGLFGSAVASRGNDIIVGAARNPGGGATDAGAVYVLDGDTGALKLKIKNPEAEVGDRFGSTLAVFP